MRLIAFWWSLGVVLVSALSAHQSAFSYLALHENRDNTVTVVFKKPLQDKEVTDLKIEFSRHCYDIVPKNEYETDGYVVTRQVVSCNQATLAGSSIWIRNLLQSDVGVIFQYETREHQVQKRLIRAEEPYVRIGHTQTFLQTALEYLRLGIEHILIGFDHLMFVFALLLLVHSLPRLIQTITAFTAAHSITLGLATWGVVTISVTYIEAMIALSIVFVARELLRNTHEKTVARSYPWVVAFVFGLLHGFGFASALSHIGLNPEHIWSTLVFFNLGVELGQLLFIGVVIVCFKLLEVVIPRYVERIKTVAVYGIGTTAAYWFIERLG
ncbi:MAG: HupE/UreJ family protein [Sulfurimonas sp.]|nr:MAG: HupE/UreJ family protein [Sulfurimonas sp.]